VDGEHQAFGLRLKSQRERRGVTLESIAESTKIKRSLLDSLERGDVKGWPLGIFRRAFVRAYAEAIGLAGDATVAEFVRLFPEPGQEPSPPPSPTQQIPAARHEPAPVEATDASLRLTLAAEAAAQWLPPLRDRLSAAAIDGLTILAVALTLWILRASSLSVSLGVASFGFVLAEGLSSGRSTVARWVKTPAREAADQAAAGPHPAAQPAVLSHRGRRASSRSGSGRHAHGGSRRERLRRASN
jgi:transcriptional regulator with XRE-family HTH domain